MPPLRLASDRLGPITAEVAAATGLDPATPVHCGIHDSNASLLPHLYARPAPFAVVSTGTWVVSMAVGGRQVALDPSRDTLINVNAFGDPVPSARFMGGREWEVTSAAPRRRWRTRTRPPCWSGASCCSRRSSPAPARSPAAPPPGACRRRRSRDGERAVAVSWYLALMTAVCLESIGADGPIVVEGPFAAQPTIRGDAGGGDRKRGRRLRGANRHQPRRGPPRSPDAPVGNPRRAHPRPPPERRAALAAYAARWRQEVEAGPPIG